MIKCYNFFFSVAEHPYLFVRLGHFAFQVISLLIYFVDPCVELLAQLLHSIIMKMKFVSKVQIISMPLTIQMHTYHMLNTQLMFARFIFYLSHNENTYIHID